MEKGRRAKVEQSLARDRNPLPPWWSPHWKKSTRQRMGSFWMRMMSGTRGIVNWRFSWLLLAMLWGWGMSGGFHTLLKKMEEVGFEPRLLHPTNDRKRMKHETGHFSFHYCFRFCFSRCIFDSVLHYVSDRRNADIFFGIGHWAASAQGSPRRLVRAKRSKYLAA